MAEIREQALALLNEVKMLQDENADDAKADGLKRMMELVLEQEDPSLLLPEFVPCLLEFRDDPGSSVRENVAEMVEGICLQDIGYMQIIAPALLALLQDSAPAVVQRAIISGSNIFQTVSENVALQGVESRRLEEDLVECWNWMIRLKEAISSLAFQPGNDDVQLLALKFVETTILLFTLESNNPLPVQQTSDGTSEEIHMTWIARGHPVLDANALEQEAYKNLELLLNQLQTPEAPSLSCVVAFAILNSLTGISERRPYMSETILPVLSGLVSNSEPVLGSRTKNIIQELKGLPLNVLASNQPGALPWREQLVISLRPMDVEETGDQINREPETPTSASSASETKVAHPSMNVEKIGDQIVKDPGTPTSASSASDTKTVDQIVKEPGTPTSASSASDTKTVDQIVKEPGTPTSVSSASVSSVCSAKVTRPSITSRTALKPRNTSATATTVTAPPRTASPLRQIRTSSPATTVTAPPRAASPARQIRTSSAAASVTAPPRTASPARQTRTPSATPSVTALPRTASPARQTRGSSVATSENAPPRAASPSRRTRTSSAASSVTAPPRTASPSRQPRTSSTATTGTAALRPASPSAKMAKTSGSIPQNGLAGGKVLRGLSPARARSGSVDDAVGRVSSSPRAGPSVENPKSSSVIVPFPPTSVKSVKPALTSLKVSPRPSPSSSPRAAPSAENPRASGVIVPFPLTAVKSMPKPSVNSVKPSPRPASPSVKPAPRSASPSVKASARPASPSVKTPARAASPSVKASARAASPSVKTPARTASSSVKSTSRAASPSARATIGTSPRTDPVNVASRPASPFPAARKSLAASPSQPPSPSPRASENKSAQVSTLNGSATGLSASSRAGSNIGKPCASTNSAVASHSPATSARSMPSPSSSSQSLLKSKIGSLTPSTRKGAQFPSCESPQNLSSGRSDPSLDVHLDSVDAIAARSVVQEIPIQRLRIASFKRNGSGLSKATEIVSPEVLPANPMTLNTKKRCGWITSQSDDVHIAYHDNEWGVPVYDDKLLFELIVLQGAQAELSWPTILARRNNFRAVFANFDPAIVAKFDEKKKLSLIADSSICFPEAKVRGAVDNAAHVLKIIEEYGSLSKFLWSYVNHKPIVSQYKLAKQVPVKTPKSEALSKELLRRGFRFVGPTTMYSVMQAAGLVCDHLVTCYKYQESSAENSPVTDLEEKVTDSWQRISLPEWRGASTIEPRVGAVDAFPHEFRRASANASDPVWAELPIIEESREDDMEKNSDDEEEYDGISTSSKCEIPVC